MPTSSRTVDYIPKWDEYHLTPTVISVCSLMNEPLLAQHLTSLPKRGVGALSSVSTFKTTVECPCHVSTKLGQKQGVGALSRVGVLLQNYGNVKRFIDKITYAMYISLHQETALYTAVKQGHTDIVKCLVDSGAEINFKDDEEVCDLVLILLRIRSLNQVPFLFNFISTPFLFKF